MIDNMFKAIDATAVVLMDENEEGDFDMEILCSYFCSKLSPEVKGHLLMQLIDETPYINRERGFLSIEDKKLWLIYAEILGANNMQQLYHCAVFGTKVV